VNKSKGEGWRGKGEVREERPRKERKGVATAKEDAGDPDIPVLAPSG